jgi:hypothetical protein
MSSGALTFPARFAARLRTRPDLFGLTVVLTAAVILYAIFVGVYMDDVFIYLRVAGNIVAGHGPVFNAGDAYFPVTSPLWVFLLALFQKVLPGPGLVFWAKFLFIFCLVAASFLFFDLLRKRLGTWAALAPLPLFFNNVTLTCAGGEIALLYLGLLGMIWAAEKENFRLVGIFAALGYLARGEALLMLAPIFLWRLLGPARKKIGWKGVGKNLLTTGIWFLSLALVWHLYYFLCFNSIFPETFKVKIIQGQSGKWGMYYNTARPHIMQFLHGHWLLVPLIVVGLVGLGPGSWLWLVFTLLHYYAYKLLAIPNYHWYYYDIDLLLAAFPLIGLALLARLAGQRLKMSRFGRGKGIRIVTTVVILILAVMTILALYPLRHLGDYRSDNRLPAYIRACAWLKPQLKPGDVVLTSEVGIIGFLLPRVLIRDTNGIATPGVTAATIDDYEYFVNLFHPAFLVRSNSPAELTIFCTPSGYQIYECVFRADETTRFGVPISTEVRALRSNFQPPPGMESLFDLFRGKLVHSQLAFRTLSGRWVLFAHAPFVSRIAVPATARGFMFSCGFIPEFFREGIRFSDGVEMRITAINGKVRTLLAGKIFSPREELKQKLWKQEKFLKVTFDPGSAGFLEVELDPRQSNACDWIYIGCAVFR